MKLAVAVAIVVLLLSTLASAQPAPPPVDLGSLGAGQLRVIWQIGQLDGQSGGLLWHRIAHANSHGGSGSASPLLSARASLPTFRLSIPAKRTRLGADSRWYLL